MPAVSVNHSLLSCRVGSLIHSQIPPGYLAFASSLRIHIPAGASVPIDRLGIHLPLAELYSVIV
jgi:hypothetical protein